MNSTESRPRTKMVAIVKGFLRWLLASFGEVLAQLRRTGSHWRAVLRQKSAARKLVSAELALGEQLARSGLGDESLRQQIVVIDDRIRSVKAAQGGSKQLEVERRGLLIRLADCYGNQAEVPDEIGACYAARNQAGIALEQRRTEASRARQSLFPASLTAWCRLVTGSMLVLIIGASLYSFLGSLFRSGDNTIARQTLDEQLVPILKELVADKEYDRIIKLTDVAFGDDTKDQSMKASTRAVYLRFRSLAWMCKDDFDNADKDLSELLKLAPDFPGARTSLGRCHLKKGNYDKAIEFLTESICRNPGDKDAYYFRACAHWEKSRRALNDNVRADYQKAHELDGESYPCTGQDNELPRFLGFQCPLRRVDAPAAEERSQDTDSQGATPEKPKAKPRRLWTVS